jgi:hypothetical protein
MRWQFCKVIFAAVGIMFSALATSAQEEILVPDEKVLRAERDILAMGEAELRAFVGALIDCNISSYMTNEQARTTCFLSRRKYQIEYGRDRAIDDVLLVLETSAALVLFGSKSALTTRMQIYPGKKPDSSDRDLTIDDVRKVIEASKLNSRPTSVLIGEIETRLEKAANKSFRNKRQQN